MLYKTTEKHEELRMRIRAFAEEKVKPIAFMLDQTNGFPHDMVKELAEMGLMGIPYPPALKNAIEVLQKQTGRKDDKDD